MVGRGSKRQHKLVRDTLRPLIELSNDKREGTHKAKDERLAKIEKAIRDEANKTPIGFTK